MACDDLKVVVRSSGSAHHLQAKFSDPVKSGHLFRLETYKGCGVFGGSVSGFFEFMGGEGTSNLQGVHLGCAVFMSFGVGAKDDVGAVVGFELFLRSSSPF